MTEPPGPWLGWAAYAGEDRASLPKLSSCQKTWGKHSRKLRVHQAHRGVFVTHCGGKLRETSLCGRSIGSAANNLGWHPQSSASMFFPTNFSKPVSGSGSFSPLPQSCSSLPCYENARPFKSTRILLKW